MSFTPNARRRHTARWLFALLVAAIALTVWQTADDRPSRLPWRSVQELGGANVSSVRRADGSVLSLAADSLPHILYVFRPSCDVCDRQKAHLAGLLSSVPWAQFLSGAPAPRDSILDYWADVGARVAEPISLDETWLRESGIGDAPLLLFVSPKGRISRAVQGSILSWSPQTVINELRRAAVADQKFGFTKSDSMANP